MCRTGTLAVASMRCSHALFTRRGRRVTDPEILLASGRMVSSWQTSTYRTIWSGGRELQSGGAFAVGECNRVFIREAE